ncbi:hypothetical protein RclHR1_03670002 [Rhizophagus clarus]|uniref:Reverse transcriptase zinc-binding domain-containing protein n=1 Tax=Rhizophagus clarus TaxID=94130 RepID=A0A2Z6RFT2_9GLOM|nr:hypothetical protein RclHR1_03670002 [Rhizophagus clarus]GES82674.1 hypothetical protein RCL_e16185_RclHR1_03670002 [Rhizophagus clarus]
MNCLLCQDSIEDFSHIWTCPYHGNFLLRTYNKVKNTIMDTIVSYHPNIDIIELSLKFDAIGLFINFQQQDTFNFIDVIKGFISFDLCNFILKFLSHSSLVSLITQAYDDINEDCFLLWQD